MAGKGGGAWKVAYADFVTAMMAFFMVMWLVGQNDKLKNSAIQNRGGKLVAVAPKAAANAKPELPMKPYDKR